MNIITLEDKQKINKLYLELGTYAAVSRATGFSPATVKKYIIPNYKNVEEKNIKRFTGSLPEFDPSMFRCKDWGHLCILSEEEKKEIEELWEEMEI